MLREARDAVSSFEKVCRDLFMTAVARPGDLVYYRKRMQFLHISPVVNGKSRRWWSIYIV